MYFLIWLHLDRMSIVMIHFEFYLNKFSRIALALIKKLVWLCLRCCNEGMSSVGSNGRVYYFAASGAGGKMRRISRERHRQLSAKTPIRPSAKSNKHAPNKPVKPGKPGKPKAEEKEREFSWNWKEDVAERKNRREYMEDRHAVQRLRGRSNFGNGL